MTYADGTPNWVDLQTPDVDGARNFYGSLFGWTTDDLGPDAGGYVIFRLEGKQVAGGGPMQSDSTPPAWTTYFATSDADRVANRVGQAGGKVLMPPMDVMNQGKMAVFADPNGAAWAVWQSGEMAGFEVRNEVGAVGWTELMTPDMDTAKAFYHAALGTSSVDMPDGTGYVLMTANNQPVAGMMEFPEEMPPDSPTYWSVYFNVEDADDCAERVVELGGSVVVEPQDSPAGRFAYLSDPQGAQFAIIQPDPNFQM